MNTNFILEIKSEYQRLTKTEKKVADYVLANTKEVLYQSITELADSCGVGDTSVYRFCRSIGLQGYQEFKMRLSLSLNDDIIKKFEEVAPDTFKSNASSIIKNYTSSLNETLLLAKEDVVLKIANKIEKSNVVYFFGVGNSGVTALDARNQFSRITNKVQYVNDADIQAMLANIMTKDDLVVLITYSGETKDTLGIAKIAKQAGASVACITHYETSPIAEYVDMLLLCGAYQNPTVLGNLGVRISQMYAVDLIFQSYYTNNKETLNKVNYKTKDAILQKIYEK